MSEPTYTEEDLRIAKEIGQRIVARYLQGIYPSVEACCEAILPAEFDAIRAEERQKAERLAEALRKMIGWAMLANDNDSWYFSEGREPDFEPDMESAKAALAAWEGALHG